MGKMIELTAADGHKLLAYRAEPAGKPKGGLIVAMEIFGVNSHIRSVADGYAMDGYLAIAPALVRSRAARLRDRLFARGDPARPGDDREGHASTTRSRTWRRRCSNVASAGKVGIVGYCWGGTVAWKAACNVPGLHAAWPTTAAAFQG